MLAYVQQLAAWLAYCACTPSAIFLLLLVPFAVDTTIAMHQHGLQHVMTRSLP
jgi:hypothetical protein